MTVYHGTEYSKDFHVQFTREKVSLFAYLASCAF